MYSNTFNNANNFDLHLSAGDPDLILKTPTKMAYRIFASTFKNYMGNYYNDSQVKIQILMELAIHLM